MFEYLGTVLVSVDPGFDVLRYLTVRTIGGTVTALLLSILMGPLIINSLKSMQFEQFVRKDGPQSHYKKTGTPTICLLYTSPSPRDRTRSRMPSSA